MVRAVASSRYLRAETYLRRSPPYRYYMMMTTSMFFMVRHLWTSTMLLCLRDFKISASTKMESMSLTEPMFYVFMIFMANFWSV